MSKYHPLTDRLISRLEENIDKIIREWLKEKCNGKLFLEKHFELTEQPTIPPLNVKCPECGARMEEEVNPQTLEEKFKEYFNTKDWGKFVYMPEHLATIAEQHFKGKE